MITTNDTIYELTELAIQKCREHGYNDVAQELEDAMHLGSSGLEILGAIKAVFVSRRAQVERVLDNEKVQEVLRYVNKAFGME